MAQNLKDLINALLDCVMNNPSSDLYEAVQSSLNTLGSKQPALFLTVSHAYILQHSRLSDINRAFILNCITKIFEGAGTLDECDKQQALLIINLATNEMTMTKDTEETWANAAKDVLVTLAMNSHFVGHVMDAILNKYPPGHTLPPHKYVVLTLAAVSQHNANGFIPFLTDVLSRTVPLLSYLKQDSIRSAWCQALCSFCEAVLENSSATKTSIVNSEKIPLSGSKIDLAQNEYADQLELAYDVVFNWTSAKDSKCRADAVESVSTLCQMISPQRINKDLKKLVTMFLTVLKKTVVLSEIFSITKGIGNFLNACCSEETLQIEHYLDDIFNTFFPHVCVVTQQSFVSEDLSATNSSFSDTQIKIRNEAFRCFHVASRSFADRQVYYLLHKMQNDKDTVKLGATNLMRHLLNSAGSQMEDKRSLITMGLKPLLTDETLSIRVKMSICQLCVALADHGYVHPEAGGQQVINFLLTNLILKPDILTSGKKTSSGTENISLNQLHLQCAQALHTIANTCQSSFTLLWPLLFEYVCVEAYNPVISDIFKCLRIITLRARESGQTLDFVTGFDANPRIAGLHQVMARLFVCLNGASLNYALLTRATEALKVFGELCVWFHDVIPSVVKEYLPRMMALLEDTNISSLNENTSRNSSLLISDSMSPRGELTNFYQQKRCGYSTLELKCAKTQRWQAQILELLNSCVCAVNNGEWRQALAAAQAKQFQLYGDNPHDKAFLMRCFGQTLSRITNTSFVIEHALLMVRSATHSNQIERVGCAMAIGHCAQTHTDLMLTELENVSKWEHTKKSNAGIFSYIKDAMPYGRGADTEVVHLRATIVLCYGYVAYFCSPELVVQRIEQTILPFLRQYIANCKEIVMKEAHLETIHLIALTVHPQHLNSDYKFESRYECFSYIKQYVQCEIPETLSSWVRLLAAKAAASLIQLDPAISNNELWDLGSILTQQTFPIGREKSGLKTLDPLSVSGFLLSPIIFNSSNLSGNTSFGYIHHRFPSAFFFHRSYPTSTLSNNSGTASILNKGNETPKSKSDSKKRKSSNNNLLTASGSTSNNNFNSALPKQNSNGLRIDDDEASTVMDATVMQYRNAIGHIVQRQPLVETVSQLLKMFIPYYNSLADHERTRAIDSTVLVLNVYAENAADCTLGRANDFSPLSSLLGRLGPRLADSIQAVRILSIRAIWLAFKLSLLRRGHSPQDTELVDSELFEPSSYINQFLGNEGKLESINCRSAIIAISKEIEKRLPQSQVQMYLSVLFKMLSDHQSYVSSSAAQLLSIIMHDRGHLLHAEAEILVSTMLENLSQVHCFIQTYTDLLNGFSLFTSHQQYVVIDVLLKQPLPYSVTNIDAWQIMARDGTQFVVAVDHVLELMGAGSNPVTQLNYPHPSIEANGEGYEHIKSETLLNKSSVDFEDDELKSTPPFIDPLHLTIEDNDDLNKSMDSCSEAQYNANQHYYGSPLSSKTLLAPKVFPFLAASDGASSIGTANSLIKPHFEVIEIGSRMTVKIVTSETCALTSALKELIKNGEPEETLFSRIPLMLAALFKILVAVVDTQFPAGTRTLASSTVASTTTSTLNNTSSSATTNNTKAKKTPIIITPELCRLASTPAGLVADALKTLLFRIRAEAVIETMNSERAFTNIIHSQHYISAISIMCRSLCDHRPKFIGPLLKLLADRVTSTCDAERIACVAVLSALVIRCPKENGDFDPDLFVVVIKALGKALQDPKLLARKLAIRGYGLIGHLNLIKSLDPTTRKELFFMFSKIAVDAALVGLDDSGDQNDQLAIEAIDALDALVNVTDPKLLTQILPQLLLRIRPCFEKENPELRAASFSLFAGLGAVVGQSDIFKESLHNNIVTILLHLNDAYEIVQRRCSLVLASTCHLLNSNHATTLVEKEIIENKPVQNYVNFLKDFSLILAISFSDRLNYYALSCANYFKSQSTRIRQNAALMTGLLLAALTSELRGTLSKELIFSGLVQLLKDPEEEVRLTTARAIACLHAFS